MEQYIDCNVVSLSQKRPFIFPCIGKRVYYKVDGKMQFEYCHREFRTMGEYFHLSLTSNEAIKEGDYYYVTYLSKVFKADELANQRGVGDTHFKVIASTDTSLNLPAIPDSFLQAYVKAQGKIDKVRLLQVRSSATIHKKYETTNPKELVLQLTDKNEVVVLDELQDRLNNILNKNKELEDAAWDDFNNNGGVGVRGSNNPHMKSFIAGAEWQKEQSTKDAIEFAKWHFTSPGSDEFNKRSKLPLEEAEKQLYELWQQSK